MRLLPREEKFFHFFVDQTKLISEAANLLLASWNDGPAGLATAAAKISELEHKGDEIIHTIFTKLNATFITPIDPEDIHSLASYLDDVLDYIEETAHRASAYRLATIPPAMIEMAKRVADCARALEKALAALSEDHNVLEHCIEINRLEDEADHISRKAVADLFVNETNPIELIKLKEIYEMLELATDACEDVADELQGVVVKNS
ncbi:MAG: DUF47 family protein [Bryobacter sp.]|jgi:hypothetical protein|nr:DUF47 family protein [Bryobacter sp.]